MRKQLLPSTRKEWREFRIAVILLAITGFMYAGMLHHEHAQEERLRAAGINIEQMIRGN